MCGRYMDDFPSVDLRVKLDLLKFFIENVCPALQPASSALNWFTTTAVIDILMVLIEDLDSD